MCDFVKILSRKVRDIPDCYAFCEALGCKCVDRRLEVSRAMSGVHPDEHIRRSCPEVGGRSELAVYWACYQVRFPFAWCAYSWRETLSGFVVDITLFIFRIATDLNLHHVPTIKPTSEKQEREILNKTRVWMMCFNLDRSTATQFGKPSTIKEDLYVSSLSLLV